MRMPVRRGIPRCAALVLVAAAGCGGAAKSTAPGAREPERTETPGAREKQQEQQPGEAGYGAPQYAQPPPADTARPALDDGAKAEPTLADAELALDRAATELSAANRDCALACKALASMRRSADRICELAGPGDPDGRCRQARERVRDAQTRVRGGCSDCEH